ncbi:hypothetical protein WICPIJ_009900 [Wickerhamomyces pijperi]|uniref:Uncharacterized protein n=1 Tax=Wickerhamomyces pijperi TaxID=599730 RepID=A0A9P8PIV7_WICPI|nr:hypothetical protein WICPIJ_009900 [Wickerhamomyces pijperi]
MPPKGKKKKVTVTYMAPPAAKVSTHEVLDYDPETKVVDEFERDLDFLLHGTPTTPTAADNYTEVIHDSKKVQPQQQEEFKPGEFKAKGDKKLSKNVKNQILDFDIDFSSDDDESGNDEATGGEPNHPSSHIGRDPLEEDRRIFNMLENEMLRELSSGNAHRNLEDYELESDIDSDFLDTQEDSEDPMPSENMSYSYDDLNISDSQEEPQHSEDRGIKNEDSKYQEHLIASGYRSSEAEGAQMSITELRGYIVELSDFHDMSAPQRRRRVKRLKSLLRVLAMKEGRDEDYYLDSRDNIDKDKFCDREFLVSSSKDLFIPKTRAEIDDMRIVDIDERLSLLNSIIKKENNDESSLLPLRIERGLLRDRKILLEKQIISRKSGSTPSQQSQVPQQVPSPLSLQAKINKHISRLSTLEVDRRLKEVNQNLKSLQLPSPIYQNLVEERNSLRERKQFLDQRNAVTKKSKDKPLPLTIFECETELKLLNGQIKDKILSDQLKGLDLLQKRKESLKARREFIISRKAAAKSTTNPTAVSSTANDNTGLSPEEIERIRNETHIHISLNVNPSRSRSKAEEEEEEDLEPKRPKNKNSNKNKKKNQQKSHDLAKGRILQIETHLNPKKTNKDKPIVLEKSSSKRSSKPSSQAVSNKDLINGEINDAPTKIKIKAMKHSDVDRVVSSKMGKLKLQDVDCNRF